MRIAILIAFLALSLTSAAAETAGGHPAHTMANAKHLVRIGEATEVLTSSWDLDKFPADLSGQLLEDVRFMNAPSAVISAFETLKSDAAKTPSQRGKSPDAAIAALQGWSDTWSKIYVMVGQTQRWSRVIAHLMKKPDTADVRAKIGSFTLERVQVLHQYCQEAGEEQCSPRVTADYAAMEVLLQKPTPAAADGEQLEGLVDDVLSIYRIVAPMSAADIRAENNGLGSNWRSVALVQLGGQLHALGDHWEEEQLSIRADDVIDQLTLLDAPANLLAAANQLKKQTSLAPAQRPVVNDSLLPPLSDAVKAFVSDEIDKVYLNIGQIVASLAMYTNAVLDPEAKLSPRIISTFQPVLAPGSEQIYTACEFGRVSGKLHCSPIAVQSLQQIHGILDKSGTKPTVDDGNLLAANLRRLMVAFR